ncbi:hypothetical protein Bca52824_085984 [Brassica carinata]|uniref:Uncharacterized protein n=1 Tax=Brassica carinata TaxID=52824 RepID=A0A8X7P6X7_BRACI|nr:hypothetical protein Bca52824_085984 [Brassica carinata]
MTKKFTVDLLVRLNWSNLDNLSNQNLKVDQPLHHTNIETNQMMQVMRRIPSGEGAEMRERSETTRVRRRSHGSALRVRQACTCSGRPGSSKCVRHGFMVPTLTPPIRRMNLRWLNFRPTPSRLCRMSSV